MQHSVNYIASQYSEISNKRNDINRFSADDFLKFAKDNIKKYSLIVNGDDLLVSTWYSDSLIGGYRKTI